ncbi:hypothetical protein [Pseudomonas sp. BBP2017]|uniref:hypothetical protein n=1 Tax=Pseudomonas sp. BBP2017 TaxID=2109731 RepID=UPI000D13054A|nr:hypothetical protein [Pseudomonas sp. BBP2017]PSS59204.1 hypothetical protein C6382_02280 [Pseudomonas sp. BBP2017]
MDTQEKRYPRERFTKQLIRICEALDKVSTREFEYTVFDRSAVCRLTVNAVWVVGSYARGALTCGDLDVVVKYTKASGAKPLPKIYTRAFFGATPGVRFYDGEPQENSSGADFSDAVLIWADQDGEVKSWQLRIDSITPDPDAGRAPRDTDCIPLRGEQLRTNNEDMELAASWYRQGILEWDYFPLDEEMMNPIPETALSRRDARLVKYGKDMAQKTLELLPAIWRVTTRTEPTGTWSEACGERATLRCGSTLISVGKPSLSLRSFESMKTRQLMLIPHRTARGPNGIWLIRRGPKHPHVLGFKKRSVFFIGKPGAPELVHAEHRDGDVRILELFDTKTQAKAAIDQTCSTPMEISQAKDNEVFDLIVRADILELGSEQIAVTDIGRWYLGLGANTKDVIHPSALAEALPESAS